MTSVSAVAGKNTNTVTNFLERKLLPCLVAEGLTGYNA